MVDIINIQLSDSWKCETSIYLSRIDEALQLNEELKNIIKKNWLHKHCPGPSVSKASSLAIRIALYANSVFSVTLHSFPEIRKLWPSGQFVLVPLVVRYIYECWGAIHYSKKTLQRLIQEENLERELHRVNRLTNGSRSEVQLPYGGYANETSINVLTFIQSLSDIDSESEKNMHF